jgi:hypothetical protein
VEDFDIGVHAPKLGDDDVSLIHKLWLEVTEEEGIDDLHHGDVVTAALTHLEDEMKGERRKEMLERMRALMKKRNGKGPEDDDKDKE